MKCERRSCWINRKLHQESEAKITKHLPDAKGTRLSGNHQYFIRLSDSTTFCTLLVCDLFFWWGMISRFHTPVQSIRLLSFSTASCTQGISTTKENYFWAFIRTTLSWCTFPLKTVWSHGPLLCLSFIAIKLNLDQISWKGNTSQKHVVWFKMLCTETNAWHCYKLKSKPLPKLYMTKCKFQYRLE